MNPDYLAFKERQTQWDKRAQVARGVPANQQTDLPPAPRGPTGRVTWRSERRALYDARQRCEAPGNKDREDYGARGLRVCEQWCGEYGFESFLEHIGPKPTPKHTLERIDNARGYEPGNVRWATWVDQANNRRSSKNITWKGETLTAAQWARRLGVPRQQISDRVNRGWPLVFVLSDTPPTLADYIEAAADLIQSQAPRDPTHWKLLLVEACRAAASNERARRANDNGEPS